MGFFSKLVKGDWSNPFDNVRSGVKNVAESAWNDAISNGPDRLKALAGVGGAVSLASFLGGAKGIGGFLSKYGRDIASAGLDWYNTTSANEAARKLAAQQMSFQERMSSTAYQRAMADMAAAGLNPALAYQQGGASSPGGASAPVLKQQAFDNLQVMLNGTSARQLQSSQSDQAVAQAEASRAGAELSLSQASRARAEVEKVLADTELSKASEAQVRKVISKLDVEMANIASSTSLNSARAARERVQIRSDYAAAAANEVKRAAAEAANPTIQRAVDAVQRWLEGKVGELQGRSTGYIPPWKFQKLK
jgi:hypothetical protein